MSLKRLSEHIEQILTQYGSSESRLWIACSGGKDSVYLVHVLAASVKNFCLNVGITLLHVNYGLRGSESDGDARFVKNLAKQYDCKILIKTIADGQQPKTGVQAWAREVRYAWFSELVGEKDLIVTGHHKNDLAENLLFRIARGSVSNLSGLRILKGQLWRPLLHLSQQDILDELSRHNLLYRHDRSNDKLEYSRNVIRRKILPEIESVVPQAVEKMCQTALDIDITLDYLESMLTVYWQVRSFRVDRLGESVPEAVRLRLLTRFLRHKGYDFELRRSLLTFLLRCLSEGTSDSIDLAGPWRAEISHGELTLTKQLKIHARATQYRQALERQPRFYLRKGSCCEWQGPDGASFLMVSRVES